MAQAYYSLLSDGVVHQGALNSSCSPELVRSVALWLMNLVANRLLKEKAPRNVTTLSTKSEKLLAKSFLSALRSGAPLSDDYAIDIHHGLMVEVRSLTIRKDFDFLMENIRNEDVSENIRADCASLILNPNIHGWNHRELDAMASQLAKLFETETGSLPWSVKRCLALALKHQAGRGDLVVRMIEDASEEEIEWNLSKSIEYYGSPKRAVEYYLSFARDQKRPISKKVWTLFFLSKHLAPEPFARLMVSLSKDVKKATRTEICEFLIVLHHSNHHP